MVSTAAGLRVVALEARYGDVYMPAFVETQRTRGAAGTPLGIRVNSHLEQALAALKQLRGVQNLRQEGACMHGQYGGGGLSGRIQQARRYRMYARVRGKAGDRWCRWRAASLPRQIQNTNKRLQGNTHLRRHLTSRHTRATLYLRRSDGGCPGVVGKIAATTDGVPLRLRVNPAPRRVASLRAQCRAASNPNLGQVVPKAGGLKAGKCSVFSYQFTNGVATRGARARAHHGLAMSQPCPRDSRLRDAARRRACPAPTTPYCAACIQSADKKTRIK